MSNVVDFEVERAYRRSGIKDRQLLRDIIDEGYDPCDPVDVDNYYHWKQFQGIIYKDIEADFKWSDAAVDKLWNDIMTVDVKDVKFTFEDEDIINVPDFSAFFNEDKNNK